MPEQSFADRLHELMEAAGYKQSDVIRLAQTHGKRLGKSQVSQYVSGKTVPRRDVLATLAEIFGVDAGWLATGAGDRTPARASKPGSAPASSAT